MKKTILDSSFILSCAKQKIDFFQEIHLMGIKIIIPKQVIEEIKKQSVSYAKLSLNILEKNKDQFETIDLGKGHVDKLLIKYADENKEVVVATLDREIKKAVKNSKLIIRGKKKLEIV